MDIVRQLESEWDEIREEGNRKLLREFYKIVDVKIT